MAHRVSRREVLQGRLAGAGDRVHIASLLVQVKPAAQAALADAASRLKADLHATAHPSKFALVLEAPDERSIADATLALFEVAGVLTVSIVAHLTEDAASLDEVIDDEPSSVS